MARKTGSQGAVTSWDALRQSAKQGYSDGIVVLGSIETIERGNMPDTIQAIQDADADLAAVMLRDAAFFRVQMLVVRAFDPVNSGDVLIATEN